jgi:hypothetical protein
MNQNRCAEKQVVLFVDRKQPTLRSKYEPDKPVLIKHSENTESAEYSELMEVHILCICS